MRFPLVENGVSAEMGVRVSCESGQSLPFVHVGEIGEMPLRKIKVPFPLAGEKGLQGSKSSEGPTGSVGRLVPYRGHPSFSGEAEG